MSLIQNSTNIPECASEVTGENSCEIVSLKVCNKPTLAQVPLRGFFGLMVLSHKQNTQTPLPQRGVCGPQERSSSLTREEFVGEEFVGEEFVREEFVYLCVCTRETQRECTR